MNKKCICVTALRAVACENEAVTVSCHRQGAIRVINAHYGRLEETTCHINIGTVDTECLFTGTRDVVYNESVMMLISVAQQRNSTRMY